MYVSHRDQNWLACQNRKGVEESGNAMDENIPSEEDLLRNGNHGANRVKVGTLLDSLEDHGAELPQVHFGTVQPATQFCAQKEIAPWHLSQSHWLNTCNENKKKNWYGQTGISSNSLGVIARNPEGSWVRTSYNRGWVYTLSAKWISDRGYWIDSSLCYAYGVCFAVRNELAPRVIVGLALYSLGLWWIDGLVFLFDH